MRNKNCYGNYKYLPADQDEIVIFVEDFSYITCTKLKIIWTCIFNLSENSIEICGHVCDVSRLKRGWLAEDRKNTIYMTALFH